MVKPIGITVYNDEFDRIKSFRDKNKEEFRRQLASKLKSISLDLDFIKLKNIFDAFRLELIQESYFFIDYLNTILINILKYKKNEIYNYKKEIHFISQLGDILTLKILNNFLKERKDLEELAQWLKKIIIPLDEKIERIERKLEDIKLYEMEEIFNEWIE